MHWLLSMCVYIYRQTEKELGNFKRTTQRNWSSHIVRTIIRKQKGCELNLWMLESAGWRHSTWVLHPTHWIVALISDSFSRLFCSPSPLPPFPTAIPLSPRLSFFFSLSFFFFFFFQSARRLICAPRLSKPFPESR